MPRTGPIVLILMVCALSLVVGLGSTPLWDPDEPRFAAATRTMVVSGDVLSPSFNGRPRFEKPILFYWLQLPFFLALGPTETAARLPSALAGVGSVVLLYLIGQCVFTERAALFAALALATVFRFVAYARQGLTDVPAMFFEMAALYGFLRASLDGPSATRHTMLGWTAVGLCALTKGPVALIPVVIWAAYLVVTRDRRSASRWRVVPGLLLASALCLPWYAVMTAIHGRAFLDVAIGYEVIHRVVDFPTRTLGVWYYMPIWPADALPWTLFFLLGCVHAVLSWRVLEAAERRGLLLCGIWFAGVLVLFSLASGKLPHYLLPIYAPLALVAGFYIDRVRRRAAAIRPWQVVSALTGAALLIVAFVSAQFLNRVTGAGVVDPGMFLPGILAAGGLAVVLAAVWSRPVAGTVALVASLVATYAFLTTYTLPRQLSGLFPYAQLGGMMGEIVAPDDRVGVSGIVPATLIFYSRHTVEPLHSLDDVRRFLEGPGRAFCVVPQREVPELRRQSRTALHEIARRPKLVARFNRLFGTASLYDSELVLLSNQPILGRPF
jgi:4-amino-4-deoxy-L-arabinose transferase-like glycosyltransferase